MQDNSRLKMKKRLSKIALTCFVFLSVFCLSYVNTFENKAEYAGLTQYEEFSTSTDRMLNSARSATLVFHRVIDFLTKRELS